MKPDDNLTLIAEIVLHDPASDSTPQAQHPFTRFDQVDALVRASESDPELGVCAVEKSAPI